MEDSAFENQRIVKRRLLMEVEGGAEVRRLHIVYFLSRKGCDEHPHLIRIHHFSRNGVRLKDVKRWLGELRGKDMPDSFAWSYKRRYKTGFVWQDLLDDHLVIPISDNEYVLKGSETSSTTNNIDFSRIPMQKEQSYQQESAKESQEEVSSKVLENQKDSSDGSTHVVSPKSLSEIEEDASPTCGSESSTLTDVSGNYELETNSDTVNQEASPSTLLSTPLLIKEKRSGVSAADESSDKSHFRKSHSSGVFRNLITCGGVDTNDSVVVMTNKRSKPFLNICSSHSSVGVKNSAKEGRFREPCASYKPLYGPSCSQCGKRFKPEKLHAHMKSCKGMKAKKPPPLSAAGNISTATRNEDSVSGYLLSR
ncbi:hypothetical protein ACS0TY_003340 [Phlomoides rotata]